MAKTYRGRDLNVTAINQKNQYQRSLGNASLNARGDKLDNKGKIIKTVEEMARERYDAQVSSTELDNMSRDAVKKPDPTFSDEEIVASRFEETEFDLDTVSSTELLEPIQAEPVLTSKSTAKPNKKKVNNV